MLVVVDDGGLEEVEGEEVGDFVGSRVLSKLAVFSYVNK